MNKSVELLKQMVQIGEGGAKHSPSPYMRWLDGHLTHADEGEVDVQFKVREEMCNPAHILHGGVIAGMMDEVLGIAVYSLGKDKFYTTINLNVDFLRPAKLGEDVVVKARIERAGDRIIHAFAALYKGDKLLAKSNSNLIVMQKKMPQL